MTQAERRERGRLLCEKLSAEVESIHPPGTTTLSWETVSGRTATFLIALTAWESTGAEKERLKVRDAYLAVTDAWTGIGQTPRPTYESAKDIVPGQ